MSVLTQLYHHQINWSQALPQLEGWAEHVVAADPAMTAATGAVLSGLKQAASNAIDLADTALGKFIGPAALATETALDAALAGVTKGVSVPFNPIINDGIDRIANAIKAEADAWALKTKAQLAANTNAPQPTSAPLPPVLASTLRVA